MYIEREKHSDKILETLIPEETKQRMLASRENIVIYWRC